MLLAKRPAVKRAARRPIADYFDQTCAACGRRGTDVGRCGKCAVVACVANASCHKQVISNVVDQHWGVGGQRPAKASSSGWNVIRRGTRR
jgi:hypothetical protein